jgi:hypothetical protein
LPRAKAGYPPSLRARRELWSLHLLEPSSDRPAPAAAVETRPVARDDRGALGDEPMGSGAGIREELERLDHDGSNMIINDLLARPAAALLPPPPSFQRTRNGVADRAAVPPAVLSAPT